MVPGGHPIYRIDSSRIQLFSLFLLLTYFELKEDYSKIVFWKYVIGHYYLASNLLHIHSHCHQVCQAFISSYLHYNLLTSFHVSKVEAADSISLIAPTMCSMSARSSTRRIFASVSEAGHGVGSWLSSTNLGYCTCLVVSSVLLFFMRISPYANRTIARLYIYHVEVF